MTIIIENAVSACNSLELFLDAARVEYVIVKCDKFSVFKLIGVILFCYVVNLDILILVAYYSSSTNAEWGYMVKVGRIDLPNLCFRF